MLQDSQRSARAGKPCWAAHVYHFLGNLGIDYRSCHDGIDERVVMTALCERYDRVWDGLCQLPREAPDRARLPTYSSWFDSGSSFRRPAYLFFDLSASLTCTYMRFRLGVS